MSYVDNYQTSRKLLGVAGHAVEGCFADGFADVTLPLLFFHSQNVSRETQHTIRTEVKAASVRRASDSAILIVSGTVFSLKSASISIVSSALADSDLRGIVCQEWVLVLSLNWLQKNALSTQIEVAARYTTVEMANSEVYLLLARFACYVRTI